MKGMAVTNVQKEAIEKVQALRKLTRETGCLTSRTQSKILQQLSDEDMVIVARELARQTEQQTVVQQ